MGDKMEEKEQGRSNSTTASSHSDESCFLPRKNSNEQHPNDTMENDNSLFSTHPDPIVAAAIHQVTLFYQQNPHIRESHGLGHIQAVYRNAFYALQASAPKLGVKTQREVLLAAMLHDADDRKYFSEHYECHKVNARAIMTEAGMTATTSNASSNTNDKDQDHEDHADSIERVALMIDWVSGSRNGNAVPASIAASGDYHMLIPRWADRLEATGEMGVVRVYQYSQEIKQPMSSAASPRATTEEQVWKIATQERFEEYQRNGAQSPDMISHYYNRILLMAKPPADIVRNSYLEQRQAKAAVEPMLRVVLTFGKTGVVDEEYIQSLIVKLGQQHHDA